MRLFIKTSLYEVLQRNSLCSDNFSFANRFNTLKSWLMKMRFSEKNNEERTNTIKVISKRGTIRKDVYNNTTKIDTGNYLL